MWLERGASPLLSLRWKKDLEEGERWLILHRD